ncbi:MAG: hypothetical protein WC824_14675 [Bacteroidota bacterium]|jgi:hypothetical protein
MTWQEYAWENAPIETTGMGLLETFTDLGSCRGVSGVDPIPKEMDKYGIVYVLTYAWIKREWWIPNPEDPLHMYFGRQFQRKFPGEVPLEELIEIEKTQAWRFWGELSNPPPSIEEQPTVVIYQTHPELIPDLLGSLKRGAVFIERLEISRKELRNAGVSVFNLPEYAISQCATAEAVRQFLSIHLKPNMGLNIGGAHLSPTGIFPTGKDAWEHIIEKADKKARIAQCEFAQAQVQLGILSAVKSMWEDPGEGDH